jgi:hypothetical protein
MTVATRRLRLLAMLGATVALGIASRKVHFGLALWDKTTGDVLYAVAAFFATALVAPRASVGVVAGTAFAACFAIECFQLTGMPVELARAPPWVHWLLGAEFAWHDVAAYAAGVVLAAVLALPSTRWRAGALE